jgi:hypothetical protein
MDNAATPIDCVILDPNNSFFKKTNKDRAKSYVILCSNQQNCDLFKKSQCSYKPIFGAARCLYGQFRCQEGPTKKARGCREWVAKVRETHKDCLNKLSSPPDKYAYVGEYIYFPYSFATMNESIPFLAHGGFMRTDNCFLPKDHWNVATICNIIDFRPYALMGGEITDYQKTHIPLFLLHLAERDPQLYEAVLAAKPEYKTRYNLEVKNYIGRTAFLKTLNHPLTIVMNDKEYQGKYQVKWLWDGNKLTTDSRSAYNNTWGEFKEFSKLGIELVPTDQTKIKVQDNSWVNKNTIFED